VTPGTEVQALTEDYLNHWHSEEFFNLDQALGWNGGGIVRKAWPFLLDKA
jgi:hypothetical protein